MVDGSDSKRLGRLAGLTYFAVIAFSSFGYLTMTAILGDDVAQAQARLAAAQGLFVLAMAASVVGLAGWAVLAVLLNRVMSPAGRLAGQLMLIFTLAGVAMNLIALWPLHPLVVGPSANMQTSALASMLGEYNHRLLLAQVFSGLWLLPFGWLILRSRSLPWPFATCLIVAAFWYLMQFATAFDSGVAKTLAYRVVDAVAGPAVFLGEFGTCAWLLAMGARAAKTPPIRPRGTRLRRRASAPARP